MAIADLAKCHTPEALTATFAAMDLEPPELYQCRAGGQTLNILIGYEFVRQGPDGLRDMRWHISVTGNRTIPAWGDLTEIAHELRPGVPFVLGIPPRSQWINVHDRCLHLWQVDDPNLVAQWAFEGRGHTPTPGT